MLDQLENQRSMSCPGMFFVRIIPLNQVLTTGVTGFKSRNKWSNRADRIDRTLVLNYTEFDSPPNRVPGDGPNQERSVATSGGTPDGLA